MKSLAVLISGTGTNLQAIIAAIGAGKIPARIATVIADRGCAGSQHALHNHINFQLIDRQLSDFPEQLTAAVPPVDLVVLAGFLSLVPTALVARFPKRIINLHPSLLPKFGGPGMYGRRVHEAVLAAGERESGCSVHFVDEHFDTGPVIGQARVAVAEDDTPASLAKKVQALEHQLLVDCIVQLLN